VISIPQGLPLNTALDQKLGLPRSTNVFCCVVKQKSQDSRTKATPSFSSQFGIELSVRHRIATKKRENAVRIHLLLFRHGHFFERVLLTVNISLSTTTPTLHTRTPALLPLFNRPLEPPPPHSYSQTCSATLSFSSSSSSSSSSSPQSPTASTTSKHAWPSAAPPRQSPI
jgi:hypothetical protein